MYLTMLTLAGIVVSLIYLYFIKDRISNIIVASQIASIMMSFFLSPTAGYFLFGFTILMTITFVLYRRSPSKKMSLLFLFSILIIYLFEIFNFPYFALIGLFQVFPIIIFIYAILNKEQFAISFMILFVVNIIAQILV